MNGTKASPQEICEILGQQKKLLEMRSKLVNVLNKVNQVINSITVENLELRSSEIEEVEKKEAEEQAPVIQYNPILQDKRAAEINQQIIDLELKFREIESDTEEDDDF